MPDGDALNDMDHEEALTCMRAHSVQPGDTKDYFLKLPVPATWTFDRIETLIQDSYPGCAWRMKGPRRMEIDGIRMLEYGIALKLGIARVGREAVDGLARLVRSKCTEEGIAYPKRLGGLHGIKE